MYGELDLPWRGVDRAGRPMELRHARRRDAARYLEHIERLVNETRFMLQGPDDELPDIGQQKDILAEYDRRPNTMCVVAHRPGVVGRQVILGSVTLVGGRTRRTRHAAELAMGVVREAWGIGIGGLLLDAALTWARANPMLWRVSLQVYGENTVARALYIARGFDVEGVHKRYARTADGFDNLVGMGIWVGPPEALSARRG